MKKSPVKRNAQEEGNDDTKKMKLEAASPKTPNKNQNKMQTPKSANKQKPVNTPKSAKKQKGSPQKQQANGSPKKNNAKKTNVEEEEASDEQTLPNNQKKGANKPKNAKKPQKKAVQQKVEDEDNDSEVEEDSDEEMNGDEADSDAESNDASSDADEANDEEETDEAPAKKETFSLFVGNLKFGVKLEEIKKHFRGCNIKNVRIPLKPNKRQKGIAFLELEDQESQNKALALHQSELNDRKIVVEKCNKKSPKVQGNNLNKRMFQKKNFSGQKPQGQKKPGFSPGNKKNFQKPIKQKQNKKTE